MNNLTFGYCLDKILISGGDTMPASKEQMEKIAKYQKANNEQILIKPRKEDRISERIQILIDEKKVSSKQAYIIQAVKNQLERDGLPIDFDA